MGLELEKGEEAGAGATFKSYTILEKIYIQL